MRSIILIVHLSLDGFVAGPQGELTYFSPGDENLAFVTRLTADADTALFGRNTYKLLDDYWPAKCNDAAATEAEVAYSNWYNAAQKIVVSGTMSESSEDNVMVIRDNPEAEIRKIKQGAGKNILIFGCPSLSQTLMKSNLIDEFQIFIYPAFFGQGLPLFASLPGRAELELLETQTLSKGEIAAHYVRK